MTRRMSAILGEYSPAGQGCTRHFSVPPLEYKNSTSYKKYRPNFGLNIQESYGKRPIENEHPFATCGDTTMPLSSFPIKKYSAKKIRPTRNVEGFSSPLAALFVA